MANPARPEDQTALPRWNNWLYYQKAGTQTSLILRLRRLN